MSQADERTAVLLIAHGSRHAPANDDLHQIALAMVERSDFPIVEACFLELADPDIGVGGDRCVARGATRVLMVPYFLSAGVHLLRDLTAARDRLRHEHPGVEFRLGQPLGPHPLLEQLLRERIRQLDADGATSFAPLAEAIVRPGEPSGRHDSMGDRARGEAAVLPSSIDTNRSKD